MPLINKQITRKDVEDYLPILVEVIKNEIPALKEVRVFGSYLNEGKWNPEKSDIDIFVEVGDENYSVRKDMQELPGYRAIENKQRQGIRFKIKKEIPKEYRDRFNIHLLSSDDVKVYSDYEENERGLIGKSMKKGRLLYPKQFKLRSLFNKVSA